MTNHSALKDANLVCLLAPEAERPSLEAQLAGMRRVTLHTEGLDALELVASGAISPLDRIPGRSVATDGSESTDTSTTPSLPRIRLPWPKSDAGDDLPTAGESVALRDKTGVLLGALKISEIWEEEERFPGKYLLAGEITLLRLPLHYDFRDDRLTPAEVRDRLGGQPTLGVFAGELIDIATERAIETLRGGAGDAVLIFVSAISPEPGDRLHAARVRACQLVAERIGAGIVIIPALAKTTPPEACSKLSAIIARAYGCTRLAVKAGESIENVQIPSIELISELPATDTTFYELTTEYLDRNAPIPSDRIDPAVATIIEEAHPMRRRQGFCVWLTGLSQSGKSTIANLVSERLLARGRAATLLDGDVVRTHLSKGLGFSKEDRDLNIRRLGFVASEIAKHGGVTIVAAISPYRSIRREVREAVGNFVEVFVNAPVAVCEARDQKGQYKKAREGKIQGFTGVDDPYEPPEPGTDFIECPTDRETPDASASRIVARIAELGYIA